MSFYITGPLSFFRSQILRVRAGRKKTENKGRQGSHKFSPYQKNKDDVMVCTLHYG